MKVVEAHRMHWAGDRCGFAFGAHWGTPMWTNERRAVTIEFIQWRVTIAWGS